MGKLTSAIFNSGSGKIGNIILSRAPGGEIYARSVANKVTNPNTPGQQAQRGLFKTILTVAQSMTHFLGDTFVKTAPNRSGYSSFMSSALRTAREESVSALDDIMRKIIGTNGPTYQSFPEVTAFSMHETIPGHISDLNLHWVNPFQAGDPRCNDKIFLLLVNPSLKTSKIVAGSNTRDDDSMAFTNVFTWSSGVTYVAAFFKDSVSGLPSTAQFLGKTAGVDSVGVIF
jgi:hypothetical protein